MRPPLLADKPITRAALEWAKACHGEQLRAVDCTPFILHPLEVAALLNGRGYDDEVVAAGLLDNLVEDTETSIDEVREVFGPRVARIVAAVTEDSTITEYEDRKVAVRGAVAASDRSAHAVFAADKVVKARELRAEATRAQQALDDPSLRRRLEHYERSLKMLHDVAPDLPLGRQLSFELWALRHLPPRGELHARPAE